MTIEVHDSCPLGFRTKYAFQSAWVFILCLVSTLVFLMLLKITIALMGYDTFVGHSAAELLSFKASEFVSADMQEFFNFLNSNQKAKVNVLSYVAFYAVALPISALFMASFLSSFICLGRIYKLARKLTLEQSEHNAKKLLLSYSWYFFRVGWLTIAFLSMLIYFGLFRCNDAHCVPIFSQASLAAIFFSFCIIPIHTIVLMPSYLFIGLRYFITRFNNAVYKLYLPEGTIPL